MKEWQRVERTEVTDSSGVRMSPVARNVLLVFYVLVLTVVLFMCSAALHHPDIPHSN